MGEFDTVEWFRNFGWSDNPFKIRPDPHHIVGFIDMRAQILRYIRSEDPFIVTGMTGAGKTTLLKWVEEQKKHALYFNFLDDIDEKKFKKTVNGNFIDRLKRFFSSHKKMVLVDEVQEMPPNLLKWLRSRYDNGDVSSLVLASIQEDLKNLEEPFVDRIGGRIVSVRNLTEPEAMKMVRQRVFTNGKNNPFTDEGLRRIFEHSKFSPRKILENCETCCIYAAQEGSKYITVDLVNSALGGVEQIKQTIRFDEPEPIEEKEICEEPQATDANISDLSPSQQEIIKLLSQQDLTTHNIAEMMNVSRASVAKQLSRLSFKTDKKLLQSKGFEKPLVKPKNKGRPVIYMLTKETMGILDKS